MNKLLEKYLTKEYPKIFVDMYGDPMKTCMTWGLSCADGWFFLIHNLCSQVQHHIDWVNRDYFADDNPKLKPTKEQIKARKGKKLVPQVVALQVKEKFGTLRFYYSGGDEVIRGMFQLAESLSYFICENCFFSMPYNR